MTKTANYEINHIDETIIITKKFYAALLVKLWAVSSPA